MILSFIKKKKEVVNVKSFHHRPIDPERDWVIIITACLVFIILSLIASVILFRTSISDDASKVDFKQNADGQSININRLNSALEFINSKGKSFLVLPAGIEPTSKP